MKTKALITLLSLILLTSPVFADLTKDLHEAIQNGSIQKVKKLIAKGADINAKSESGWAALHLAVARSETKIVELLISKGAKLEMKDIAECTPLYYVSKKEVGELLIKKGANIQAVCPSNGFTPLHDAVYKGHVVLVKVLLDHKADVHAKTKDIMGMKETPLHTMSRSTKVECLKLLLAAGADINAKNETGRTPLDIALDLALEDKDAAKLSRYLISKGAKKGAH